MSKITLSSNPSGTGTFTIASPNSNTDRTLTLPDAAGTVVTDSATQTLTNKTIDASQLSGNVAAARITSALNATGSAPLYACRAWVNFNGKGTVAIRASGNVTSITDNGVGDYTVNFTTAMPDANYAVIRSIDFDSTGGSDLTPVSEVLSATTDSVRVTSEAAIGTRYDVLRYEITIFR